MLLCETARKLFLLSPVYCWPLQPARVLHVLVCVRMMAVATLTFPVTSPLGTEDRNCVQCSRPGALLSFPSGVPVLSVPYIPDVALALLSTAATVACLSMTLSSDFIVMIVMHSHAAP